MLLKMPAKSVSLLFLLNILFVFQVFSQTTSLSFTAIPISNADLNAPGRGVEQWHDQNLVNVPVEGTNTQRLDVYYRFVWTQIEGPTLGSYSWTFFDGLVNQAITKKQKFSFGIMQLYPGGATSNGLVSFDGGLASYPLYLHTLMQAETVKDWRTGTVWTPNYNSLNYQNRLLALYQAIDAHIKSTSFNGVPYRNVIGCIDIRGYGAWGEWHSGYTQNNVISDYPAGTFPTVASLKKIVDAHTQGFPDFPLVAMIAAFDANWLQNTMNPPEIAHYVLTQRNNWGLIGWRRDQWGATDSYIASYLENNTRSFNGLVFRDSIMVRWKSAPITGEPPGWVPSNYSDLERQIRLYHATSFGNGNYGTTSPTTTIKNAIRASSKACGYRLIIEGGSLTTACRDISLTLNWKNTGQAPTYENWDVMLELKNGSGVVAWTGTSQFKPRLFQPLTNATAITDNFSLPANLPGGTYTLNIIVRDPTGYRDPLPLAINGINADKSYTLSQVTIGAGSPGITVANNCGNSVLTATGYTGSLLWNTGATTPSITVNTAGTYSVTQTLNSCTSAPASAVAAPGPSSVPPPTVTVINNCGNSVLTASDYTGSLLWSTGAATESITVTSNSTYTVRQTLNNCTSPDGIGVAAPKPIPALNIPLSTTAGSGTPFTFLATSTTPGTSFTWSRSAVAGISNLAATGTGNVDETLVNITASPVVVTYVYTLSANGCTNTQNVLVTVGVDASIVAPAMTSQPTPQTKCAGDNVTFSSDASGGPVPTVQWQQSTNNGNSWNNIGGATSSTLSFTTTTADNGKQYRAVWTNIAGTATSSAATLTVNSIPSAPTVAVINNCGSSLLTATGTSGAIFSWSNSETGNSITVAAGDYTATQRVNGCTSAPSIIATAAPKAVPIEPSVSVTNNCGTSLLTASGDPGATFTWSIGAPANPITVASAGNYTVTQTVNGCTGPSASATASPKPVPVLTSSVTAAATSSAVFSYTASSTVSATTFTWSRAAVAGISNSANNGTGDISETLVNTTASPVIVTYVYTLTTADCSNTQNVQVTVSVDGSTVAPTVTTQPASQTWCAGGLATFSSGASGGPAPTVQWQDSPNGNTWSNIPGATSSTLSFTTTTADNNKRYRAVWTNIAGTVNSNAAILTVNAIPGAPSISTANNCGSSVLSAPGGTGITYLWSTGETTNSITVPQGDYTVTQTINGCTGPAANVTANPKLIPAAPGVSVTDNCGSSLLTASGDPGATYLWSTGATTQSTNVTIASNYTVRQTVNGCQSAASNPAEASPKPVPALSNSLTTSATSSSLFTYSATSSTSGTSFTWSRAAVAGISNSANNGTGDISETLVNTTASPVIVTYVYTLTTADCSNTQNVQVTVSVDGSTVAPTVTTQPASQTWCAGGLATFSSGASGGPAPTVQWQDSPNGNTWSNIPGATSSTLSFTTTTADNNKRYRAVWTNIAGTVNSNAAILTVNAVPILSSSLTANATSGSAFSYTATSSTSGTSFAWSRAAVTGISNAAANGSGNISETLINTTTSPVNVTYAYTLTANGCTNSQNVIVAVNFASPTITTQPGTQTRCAGVTASFTSAASGSPAPTVQWQVSTNGGTSWGNISGETASTYSFATATTDNNKQYRAVWTNIAGTANSNAAILTVNAVPVLSSGLTATATSGTAFAYTAASSTPGTSFAWSRATVPGISNTTASGNGNINETLLNTTTSPVNVTYVYTLTANGCSNTQNVVVTVNASIVAPAITTQPTTQTRCAGVIASFTSAASGSPAPTVQWQVSTNGGTSWGNISGETASTYSFATATTDNNKQYRAVWTNIAGTANSNAAILTVNAVPVLSSGLTATATSGTAFAYTAASSTPGTSFAWSRATVPGISNTTASGNGNINETLLNTTTSPVNVTYVYTLIANGCSNTQNLVVTVNASIVAPAITTQPTTQTRCAGVNASFTSAASGSPAPTVQWQVSTNGGTNWSNISGATTSTYSFATTTADNNKQYRAVWTNSGGTINSNAATLTVTALAVLSSGLTSSATSGSAFTYTATSSTTGTTFAWSRATVTGISNAAANGSGNISEILINTTTSAVNVTYVYTLTANGCSNTQNVVVTVNASIVAPAITTQPTTQTRCAGVIASFTSAASGSPAPTVQWQVSTNGGTNWSNISGATASTYSFATTTADNNKRYRAVWTNTGGTSNSSAAILTVNPTPVLSSSLTANATSGTAFTYTATSSTTGTTFAWSRAAVTGISNTAANGTGNISETLLNTTASSVNVTYVYTLTANGCTNTQNVVVTVAAVTSVPAVTTQPAAQTRCAGTSASFTSAASGTPAPTVQWQVSTNGGFSYSNISGATNSTLTFVTTTTDNNRRYRAVWTNVRGSVNSSSALLTVNAIPSAPTVSVTNNCGNSVLTATGTGSLLWNTGATTSSITVTTAGTYTVTRTVNGCSSTAASAVAAPRVLPVVSSNLAAAVTTGNVFTYTPTSVTTGTTFAWSRAAVTGISNAAATGTNGISETLTNTTGAPVNVTYVYTLTANGCTNTQNLVVTVNPIYCVINGAITSSFNSTSIPAGRYIWFNSALDRGSLTGITGNVTFNITNGIITFTANSQQYTLNVPNARIRYDAAVTSATTQFVNNVWETVMPRTFTDYVFMSGLSYQVPASLPGSITNVRWSATITIDKAAVSATWKWSAAVYTSFAAHSGLNIKPKNGSTQNPYANNDLAGTPENFKTSLVSGAKGSGGTNYTGTYSTTSTATCTISTGTRPAVTEVADPLIVKEIPTTPVETTGGEELNIAVLPNPTSSSFNLIVNGKRKGLASVKVIDISGRVVERHEKVPTNGLFRLGQRLAAGSYLIEVVQDDHKKIIRVIKVN